MTSPIPPPPAHPSRREIELLDPVTAPGRLPEACTHLANPASPWSAVVVLPGDVAEATRLLKSASGDRKLPPGRGIISVAGFPLGGSKTTIKAIEASSAVKDRAAGVEVVPRFRSVLLPDPAALRDELTEIARAARAADPDVHLRLHLSAVFRHTRPERSQFDLIVQSACTAALQSGFDAVVLDAPDANAHTQGLTVKLRLPDTAALDSLPPTPHTLGIPG